MSTNIKNKLKSLSVRDVNTILNGIDLYIQKGAYKGRHFSDFNTKSPLTYTILILKLLGITEDEIKNCILQLPILDLLNCINVFLYTSVMGAFNFRGNLFYINRGSASEHDIVKKIQIGKLSSGYTTEGLNDDQIENCINKAFDYITK